MLRIILLHSLLMSALISVSVLSFPQRVLGGEQNIGFRTVHFLALCKHDELTGQDLTEFESGSEDGFHAAVYGFDSNDFDPKLEEEFLVIPTIEGKTNFYTLGYACGFITGIDNTNK